jgi:hypothetical protein
MKKYFLFILLIVLAENFVFADEKRENWEPAKLAIEMPLSLSLGDNFNYFSFTLGGGMRIKTVKDLYLHPSISYAMIIETHTITEELFGKPWEYEELDFLSKVAFRIAFEYTVYKYSALRQIGHSQDLTYFNPLVTVDGDIGPIIGISYADGLILDAGISWREHSVTSSYGIQYNFDKNIIGFLMAVGFCF